MKTKPKKQEEQDARIHVGFRADDATMAAIEVITEDAQRRDAMSSKSSGIRAALQEVAARILSGEKTK